jgi:hypothetical protein
MSAPPPDPPAGAAAARACAATTAATRARASAARQIAAARAAVEIGRRLSARQILLRRREVAEDGSAAADATVTAGSGTRGLYRSAARDEKQRNHEAVRRPTHWLDYTCVACAFVQICVDEAGATRSNDDGKCTM